MTVLGLLFLPLLFTAVSAPQVNKNEAIKFNTASVITSNVDDISVVNWAIYQEDVRPLTNMVDGDDTTFAWVYFTNHSATSSIIIKLKESVTISDLYIKHGDNPTNYLTSGAFYVSNDSENPTYELVDSFNIDAKENIYIPGYGRTVRYIKLDAYTSYLDNWVQISEIGYNSGHFDEDLIESASFSWNGGLIPGYSINHMFDDNDSTYLRLGRPNNGDTITVNFNSPATLSSVRFKMHSDSDDECFYSAVIKIKTDGDFFIPNLTGYLGGTYQPQYVDLRDDPIDSVTAVRLEVTSYKGWVKIADFSFNNIPDDYIKVTSTGPTELYRGCITSIFDGNSDTQAWFNNNVSSLVFDLRSVYRVNGIRLQTGKINNEGDYFWGDIQYSMDGTSYTKIADIDGQNVQSFNLDANARYIKLTNNNSGWSAIRIFEVDKSGAKIASQSGLPTVTEVAGNTIDLIADGNLDFAYWADWHFENGSYVQVEYPQTIEANNIIFLQEGYKTNYTGDVRDNYFSSFVISWSIDGSSWSQSELQHGSDDVLIEFNTPQTVRYIRATYVSEDISPRGVGVREFAVNFEKQTIDSSFISNPTVRSSSFKGYDVKPWGLDLTITYSNLRTNSEPTETIPTEVSKYEVTLYSEGNDIYNACDLSVTMTVGDEAGYLGSAFNALLDNGSICSALGTDAMDSIIYRYDNCLSDFEKNWMAENMTFKDSEGNDASYNDAIEYARQFNASNSGNQMLPIISESSEIASIIIVSIVTFFAVILMGLYFKSRKIKE